MNDYNLVCHFENGDGINVMVDLRTIQAVASDKVRPGYSLFDMGAGVLVCVSGEPADIQRMALGVGVHLKVVEPPAPVSNPPAQENPPLPSEEPGNPAPQSYEI